VQGKKRVNTRQPRFSRFLAGSLLVLLLAIGPVFPAAAATFVINNTDSPGEGFNDLTPVSPVGGNNGTTLGQQRLNLFQRAADIWGGTIESNVPIIIQASFDPLSCDAGSAILGSAGTITVIRDFPNAPQSGTWYHIALANALAGYDLSPSDDIVAQFNSDIDNNNSCLSGTNWYLGFDHNHGSDIDLLVVLLHEFAHGLGFSNFVNLSTGSYLSTYPDIYTHFTLDNSNSLHWDDMNNGQRRNSATNTGNVVWDGQHVANSAAGFLTSGQDGAGNVRLFAPDPLQSGSSISHFDTVASPSLLMEPYITSNLGSDLDLTDEQLFDVGWNLLDSDGDGLSDSFETYVYGSNPNVLDTDGDGLVDGSDGVVPVAALPGGVDSDSDGFVDGEQDFGTLPSLADSDGDQLNDGVEVGYGSDPQDPGSWPNIADGDLAPLGSPDGQINGADYLIALRIATGELTALPLQLAHGDLYPDSVPDDVINLQDVLLLIQLTQSAP
jgi:hypothetical protein